MAFAVNTPVFVFFLIVLTNLQPSALSAPQVPCFFIFGDSLVDNGNNNQLKTEAKVNYLPYGIDFPQGPTGRFTNGQNTADILAQLLGFDTYIPPFAMAQGKDIIKGVNYASGSAGIRSETGQQLDKQLLNHNLTITRIAHLLGDDTSAKEHLSKCLYYFVVGSNDYINNYFSIIPQATLYNFGARKVSVSGLGPIGCIPAELARGTNGSACVDSINNAVQLFNDKLKLLVNDLNNNLTDAKFIFIGALNLRPEDLFALGISILSTPCCKVSNTTGQCIPGQTPCPIRALHLFYDNFHPTEIVNKVVATAAYTDMLKLIH
ncbi:hypothetical protein Pfo_025589 [Paulownia fortunei]|nr:hypothetical protein Pfo_025589 [Paulownia fortunei]